MSSSTGGHPYHTALVVVGPSALNRSFIWGGLHRLVSLLWTLSAAINQSSLVTRRHCPLGLLLLLLLVVVAVLWKESARMVSSSAACETSSR